MQLESTPQGPRPFRAAVAMCEACGAGHADQYSHAGQLVCRACAGHQAAQQANVRLQRGRRGGTVGAVIGTLFGLTLIIVSCLWWSQFSLHQLLSWGKTGIAAVAFGPAVGILILGTSVRNLLRLMT